MTEVDAPLEVMERHQWDVRGAVLDRGCDDIHPHVTHINYPKNLGFWSPKLILL